MADYVNRAKFEEILEDIAFHFKDAVVYGHMLEMVPPHVADYHLAKWLRKAMPNEGQVAVLPIRLNAADIDKLGCWSESPQGHPFWERFYDSLNNEVPVEKTPVQFQKQLFNLE